MKNGYFDFFSSSYEISIPTLNVPNVRVVEKSFKISIDKTQHLKLD